MANENTFVCVKLSTIIEMHYKLVIRCLHNLFAYLFSSMGSEKKTGEKARQKPNENWRADRKSKRETWRETGVKSF